MTKITFPFGLENEADIYCNASKIGIETDPNASKIINEWSDNLKKGEFLTLLKQEMFDAISCWTRNTVQKMNDESEDNVAWIMALYCSSVIKANMPDCSFDYDEIFKYAFKDYYSQFNY